MPRSPATPHGTLPSALTGSPTSGDPHVSEAWFGTLRDCASRWNDEIAPIAIGLQPRYWTSLEDAIRFLAHLDDRECRVFVGLLVQHLSTRQTLHPNAAVEQLARFALSAPGLSAMTEQLLPADHAYLDDHFVTSRLDWPSHLDPAGHTFLSRVARRRDETLPDVEHCLHCLVMVANRTLDLTRSGTTAWPSSPDILYAGAYDTKLLTVCCLGSHALATPINPLPGEPQFWVAGGHSLVPDTPPGSIPSTPPSPADPQDEPWDTRLRRLREAQAKARAAADLATDELDRAIAVAHAEGHTQVQIAEALSVSQPLVHRLIRRGKNADLASPLALARRYRAGLLDRERLLNILADLDYRTGTDASTLGYNDLPDQGAWGEVIQAHRAGYLTDDDYAELAARVFGQAAVEDAK